YRRFVQMYGNVVMGVEGARFEDEIRRVKDTRGVREDTELDVDALRELTTAFKGFYDFPADPQAQLQGAIRAVFDSWMGKRPAQAAVRFAVDAVQEGLLTREAALLTIDAERLDALLHPTFDPSADFAILARGVAASPGAASGAIVFTADDAVAATDDVVLVR